MFAIPSASFGCINAMLHQTFLFLGQLWRLFEMSQILEFLRNPFLPCPVSSVCIPILVTMFPEWLSGTEPLPHTPGAVRPSSLCLQCLRAHAQFCRFDKAGATADVQ